MVFRMERLDRIDWVYAGLSALSEGGIAAVRVELLAKRLGITKGSFYWHFARREDLLGAMIEEWERSQTASVITEVESLGGDPYQRLQYLSDALSELDLRLEAAIRGWGGSDPDVRKTIERIDTARLIYLQSVIESAGVPTLPAQARARLVYFALIGELINGRADWLEYHQEAMRLNRTMLLTWP